MVASRSEGDSKLGSASRSDTDAPSVTVMRFARWSTNTCGSKVGGGGVDGVDMPFEAPGSGPSIVRLPREYGRRHVEVTPKPQGCLTEVVVVSRDGGSC